MASTPDQDARRRRENPWRRWYSLKAWRKRRARQLRETPWCEGCKAQGMTRPATIADHVIPHRGDWDLFIRGKLKSLCSTCHDAAKQREERRGFAPDLDPEGWPVDPAHPFNRLNDRG